MLRITMLFMTSIGFLPITFGKNCDSLESAHWLSGDWSYQDANKTIQESWRIINDNTLEGRGQTHSVPEDKLISAEELRLVSMTGQVFLIAKVASNEFPVPFKLSHCDAQTLVFENTSHDFPQKIIYQLVTKDTLKATVSSKLNKGFEIVYKSTLNK